MPFDTDYRTMTPGSAVAGTLQDILARRRDEQRQAMLEKLILAEQTLMEVMNTRHFTVSDGRVVAHPDTGLALEDNDPRIRAATALSMVVMRHSKLIGADMPVRLEIKDVTVSSTGRTVEEELNALADELGLNDAQPG